MSKSYIVKTMRQPRSKVLPNTYDMLCPVCGNADQDKFLTVTSLAGSTLHGFVCAICEEVSDELPACSSASVL